MFKGKKSGPIFFIMLRMY